MENKKQALKEMSFSLKSIQLGKSEYNAEILLKFQELLEVGNYFTYRDQYIELLHVAFSFRTPHYTHPVKTAAASYLDSIMSEHRMIEWGLLLGFLTEGYISKSLAMILTKHSALILDAAISYHVISFIKEIKERNGNLNENGSISPFNEAQQKRVDELMELYKPALYKKTLEEMAE